MSYTAVGNLNTRHFVKVIKQISIEKLFRYAALRLPVHRNIYLLCFPSCIYLQFYNIITNIKFRKKIRRSVIKWFYRYLYLHSIRVSFFILLLLFSLIFWKRIDSFLVIIIRRHYKLCYHSVYLNYFFFVHFFSKHRVHRGLGTRSRAVYYNHYIGRLGSWHYSVHILKGFFCCFVYSAYINN